jgi:glycine cleavage system pyridoxal-binding protein P
VAAARAAAMLDHAEIEAEAVRLMKRSHTQASAEAEIRAQLEWERQQELKELKERHEAEVSLVNCL